ncbi:hypothetical protein ACFJIV_26200 [Mucilaginibacter sp. UC70_90]
MSRIKTISITLHLTGWITLMAIPLIFLHSGSGFGDIMILLHNTDYWLFGLTFMIVFYSNTFFVQWLLLNKNTFPIALLHLFYCLGYFVSAHLTGCFISMKREYRRPAGKIYILHSARQ